jgi:hypothetical protein
MMTKRVRLLMLTFCAAAALTGCGGRGWSAKLVRSVEGFSVPESTLVDPATGNVYVSNIACPHEGDGTQYWAADGTGFVSLLNPDGVLEQIRWIDSHPQAPLNSPKGLCILDGVLHVADLQMIHRFNLSDRRPLASIQITGARRINDLATDGQAMYASDTAAGKVYRIAGRQIGLVKAPEAVNGLAFHEGRMYCVSWTRHEVFELDPTGKLPPRPFALAWYFTNLDGIVVLDDGSFLVSDFMGDKVCVISPDRRHVRTVARVESPADISVNREKGLLFVPMVDRDRVEIYELRKRLLSKREATTP